MKPNITLLILTEKQVITTYEDGILSNSAEPCPPTTIASFTHEEADSRLILHLSDMAHYGISKILKLLSFPYL